MNASRVAKPKFRDDHLVSKGSFLGTFFHPEGLHIMTHAQHVNHIGAIIALRKKEAGYSGPKPSEGACCQG
eukprot:12892983-Prorocentrum_lima.AAC.1